MINEVAGGYYRRRDVFCRITLCIGSSQQILYRERLTYSKNERAMTQMPTRNHSRKLAVMERRWSTKLAAKSASGQTGRPRWTIDTIEAVNRFQSFQRALGGFNNKERKLLWNKPTIVGATIPVLADLYMHDLHYNVIKIHINSGLRNVLLRHSFFLVWVQRDFLR